MNGSTGEFDELVLVTIVNLDKNSYGVAIKEDIEERRKRVLSLGALYSTLTRLEEKGYIKSWMSDPTGERDGRRKRFFELTQRGKVELHYMRSLRDGQWKHSKMKITLTQ